MGFVRACACDQETRLIMLISAFTRSGCCATGTLASSQSGATEGLWALARAIVDAASGFVRAHAWVPVRAACVLVSTGRAADEKFLGTDRAPPHSMWSPRPFAP